jgi:gas vesicle protein
MRFKLGAAIGFAAGYLAATKASEDRRRQVDQAIDDAIQRVRENPRVRHVGEVVSRDAKRIGDAVEDRFAETADNVVESVATTVEPGSSSSTASGTGATSKNAAKSSATR